MNRRGFLGIIPAAIVASLTETKRERELQRNAEMCEVAKQHEEEYPGTPVPMTKQQEYVLALWLLNQPKHLREKWGFESPENQQWIRERLWLTHAV